MRSRFFRRQREQPHLSLGGGASQREDAVLSPPSENVRFVQSRNVRFQCPLSWRAEGPMETERITLSQRERDRLKVLHEVKQKHLSQVAAAERPSASPSGLTASRTRGTNTKTHEQKQTQRP